MRTLTRFCFIANAANEVYVRDAEIDFAAVSETLTNGSK